MEFTLNLSEKDIEIIDSALQNMPYKYVVELFYKINKQIKEQNKNKEVEENK